MTGHVRARGQGTWELKFDAGTDPATGKRITRYRSFKGTKRAAEIELARLVTVEASGAGVDPSKLTLAEFLDRWREDWAVLNLSPKTIERYDDLIKNHIKPHLGAAKLQRLKPDQFVKFYAGRLRAGRGAKGGLAARTVGHIHRILHRAFGHAVQWGLLTANPVVSVDPPPVESTELEILDEAQIRHVLMKLRGSAIYPMVVVALATGMRRGELLALRWKDVQFDAAKLRVEQSLEQTEAGLRFKPPKTRYGRRSITLPAYVVTELRRLRVERQELWLKLGAGKVPDDGLVFGTWEGDPRSPNAVTKEWERAVVVHALPRVTLHALRHSHASQLIASGMDVLTISRRMGHGSPAITLSVYGHLFSNTDDRAAQLVEAAFSGVMSE